MRLPTDCGVFSKGRSSYFGYGDILHHNQQSWHSSKDTRRGTIALVYCYRENELLTYTCFF